MDHPLISHLVDQLSLGYATEPASRSLVLLLISIVLYAVFIHRPRDHRTRRPLRCPDSILRG